MLNIGDFFEHSSKSYDYHFTNKKTESLKLKKFPRSLSKSILEATPKPMISLFRDNFIPGGTKVRAEKSDLGLE